MFLTILLVWRTQLAASVEWPDESNDASNSMCLKGDCTWFELIWLWLGGYMSLGKTRVEVFTINMVRKGQLSAFNDTSNRKGVALDMNVQGFDFMDVIFLVKEG